MCLVISAICVLSALRRTADSASESPMESQDQEEVADSASESSALEQVQEGVADSASESSALEASSMRLLAQPGRAKRGWVSWPG